MGKTRCRRHFSARFCKNVVVTKQVENRTAVLAFFDQQNGSVVSNRISEQPILETKGKINGPGCKF